MSSWAPILWSHFFSYFDTSLYICQSNVPSHILANSPVSLHLTYLYSRQCNIAAIAHLSLYNSLYFSWSDTVRAQVHIDSSAVNHDISDTAHANHKILPLILVSKLNTVLIYIVTAIYITQRAMTRNTDQFPFKTTFHKEMAAACTFPIEYKFHGLWCWFLCKYLPSTTNVLKIIKHDAITIILPSISHIYTWALHNGGKNADR